MAVHRLDETFLEHFDNWLLLLVLGFVALVFGEFEMVLLCSAGYPEMQSVAQTSLVLALQKCSIMSGLVTLLCSFMESDTLVPLSFRHFLGGGGYFWIFKVR